MARADFIGTWNVIVTRFNPPRPPESNGRLRVAQNPANDMHHDCNTVGSSHSVVLHFPSSGINWKCGAQHHYRGTSNPTSVGGLLVFGGLRSKQIKKTDTDDDDATWVATKGGGGGLPKGSKGTKRKTARSSKKTPAAKSAKKR